VVPPTEPPRDIDRENDDDDTSELYRLLLFCTDSNDLKDVIIEM
jgi:hypothetical protein